MAPRWSRMAPRLSQMPERFPVPLKNSKRRSPQSSYQQSGEPEQIFSRMVPPIATSGWGNQQKLQTFVPPIVLSTIGEPTLFKIMVLQIVLPTVGGTDLPRAARRGRGNHQKTSNDGSPNRPTNSQGIQSKYFQEGFPQSSYQQLGEQTKNFKRSFPRPSSYQPSGIQPVKWTVTQLSDVFMVLLWSCISTAYIAVYIIQESM